MNNNKKLMLIIFPLIISGYNMLPVQEKKGEEIQISEEENDKLTIKPL